MPAITQRRKKIMQKKKILLIFIIVIVASISAFILFNLLPSNQSLKTDFTPVKFGTIPITDSAPLYVAIEKGYFKENGIEPFVTTIRGGALIINAMQSDEIDIGFSNTMSFLLANAEGIDLMSIGGVAVNDLSNVEGAILARKDSNINSLKDLEGHVLGINAIGNIVELSIKIICQKNGIDFEKIRLIEVPFPKMPTVLQQGDVDAIAVAEPFWTMTEKLGEVKMLGGYFSEAYNEIEIASLIANKKWVNSHPDLTQKIQNSIFQAVDFCTNSNNEEELRKIVKGFTGLKDDIVVTMRMPTFSKQFSKTWLETLAKDMQRFGYLEQEIAVAPLIH